MSFFGFVVKSLAVVIGAFAEVTFFATMAGVELSKWPHIALAAGLALPFLYAEDGPAEPIPPAHRGERLGQAVIAGAAILYLSLAVALFVLIARGVSLPNLTFLMTAPAIGALPVAVDLVRAGRRLRGPPSPAPESPFTGGYRTRPPVPLAPDPPIRPPPPPPLRPARTGPFGMLLVSLTFVAAGLFMANRPRHPADSFWGLLSALFFGLCAWVFLEQLVSGSQALGTRAGIRTTAALIVASASACYLAWTTTAVSLSERLLVGGGAAALMVLGVVALWRRWRRDQPR